MADASKEIAIVERLLKTVTDLVNGLEIYPRGQGVFLDAVVLALVSKNRSNYAVVVRHLALTA